MTDKEWLAGLKPGDKVFHRGRYDNDSVIFVKRKTKTQIVCAFGNHEKKFRLSDGFGVGEDCWSTTHIVPVTEEVMAELRVKMLKRKAADVRKSVAIPKTEDDLISFIADMEKWIPKTEGGTEE